MNKADLVKEFKKAYESVHGRKCKDLILEDWSSAELRNGVSALNSIIDKK